VARVAFVTNALTIGGTEKMLASCALRVDRERFSPGVVAVQQLGPRADQLRRAGLPVSCAEGDEERLGELLAGVDLVHVFRHGATEPTVPSACRRAGVAHLVEENIFGHVDVSDDEALFDCHLFMSKMCLLRYRDRLGTAPPDFHRRHKVLSSPIEIEALRRDAPPPAEARRLLGLDPDRPVVGRVGRDADLKWRRLLVDMVPHLLERVPDAQVLLVGATPAKVARLRRLGVLDRCVLHDPTPDPERLAAYYAACDVFVTAAEIGESQGLAIGEALALGIPVVTSSTPWADNAQVEFVEHGRSGWLAGHPRSFAAAVADLLADGERRAAFGAAGADDVQRTLSPEAIIPQLERLYAALLQGAGPPAEWDPAPEEVERFASDYERRSRAEFSPPSPRERVDNAAARARERVAQVRGALVSPGSIRRRRG
jgi:glycosyltransferase involved in cell wall biosynthesis